jgi:hypothetical protein
VTGKAQATAGSPCLKSRSCRCIRALRRALIRSVVLAPCSRVRAFSQQALRKIAVRAQRLEPFREPLLPQPARQARLPTPRLRMLPTSAIHMVKLEERKLSLSAARAAPTVVVKAKLAIPSFLRASRLPGLLQIPVTPLGYPIYLARTTLTNPVLIPRPVLLLSGPLQREVIDQEERTAASTSFLLRFFHVTTVPGVLTQPPRSTAR